MSVVKQPAESAAVAIPFTVRMEPYLVESICELSRMVRDKGKLHTDISGLLFGKVESGFRTVEALKTFADPGPHSNLARRERVERVYRATLEEAKHDSELAAYDVVGWFSFRSGSGLLSSDVIFHNEHFRKFEDVALIIWREGPSQITAEFYSKIDGKPLTAEDYRWGSVRLSADIRHMRESVELAMRVKIAEESDLKGYDSDEPNSRFGALMRGAEALSDKFFGFLHKPKEEDEDLDIGIRRLPNRASWPAGAEASEPAADQQMYFDPYLEPATKPMGQLSMAEIGKPAAVATAAGAFTARAAPSASTSAAPASKAPDRQPEFRADPRPPQPPPAPAPAKSEFDFELSRLGRNPRTGRSIPTEVSGLPMVMRPPAPKSKSSSWPWAAALFVATSATVFALLLLGGMRSDGGRVSQAFHTVFPGGDLNLRVGNDDDRLRLTWNQRNPIVAAASDATLQIFDGQQHRAVHLDGRQVADGVVLYRPLTNDVTFRLEVRGEQGATAGSVRVLDGLADQQPLDVSAPKTAASHPGTSPNTLADSKDANLKDPGAPTLIRPDAGVSPPAADTPVPVPPQHSARAAKHYETPQSIGTPPDANGSTINSWDTSNKALRSKARTTLRGTPPVTGSGFIGPRPLMQVMPTTSAIPSGSIQSRTQVKVEVRVDPAGKVAAARVVSAGAGAGEPLEAAALAAARQWTFEPASSNGQHVESDHTIVFEFRPQR